jgi:predicted ATPase
MPLELDNVEHVLDAAPVVGELLGRASRLRLLATSRARLQLAGERIVDVEPLAVDRAGSPTPADAVALFDQAASAIDPTFDLAEHLDDVVAICRAVDGLPLAIELAAAHVRTLPPVLLRTRLVGRLGVPGAAARDAPARQQTIPATIDWSLQLLGPSDRRTFARLGVFASSVSLEAIDAVCAEPGVDVVAALSTLVDHSLVRRIAGPGREPRFVLLELVRERARDLLGEGERDEVAAAHARYVVGFLEDLDERRWHEESDRWIDLIAELLPEIRAAHEWAGRVGDAPTAARITAGMGTFWHREGHHGEGRRWVAEALAHAEEAPPPLTGRILIAAGLVEWPRDQHVARVHWERATEIFRELGDRRHLAYALALSAGTFIADDARYEEGLDRCDEGIALARAVGERPLIAQALDVRGELTRVRGDDDAALAAYEEGMALAVAAGDRAHQTVFLANLAYLADHRGEYEEARRLGCESLRLCRSLGRRMMAAWTVSEMAGPELGLGRPERAAVLVGAADAALGQLDADRHPGDRPEHARVMAGLRAALDPARFAELTAAGAAMSLDAAIDLALSEDERPPGQP